MSDSDSNQGYKSFNSTGRDDSTTEIIRPKGNAQRVALFVAIVLTLLAGLTYFGFKSTGLNPFANNSDESHGFGRPNVDISNPRN
jgi:hypothetical protein